MPRLTRITRRSSMKRQRSGLGLRIPTFPARDSDINPATHSEPHPATCSDMISARRMRVANRSGDIFSLFWISRQESDWVRSSPLSMGGTQGASRSARKRLTARRPLGGACGKRGRALVAPGGYVCSSPPVGLRRDSPLRSMRYAVWMMRSRMASARVGSPMIWCQCSTGTWLVISRDPQP